MNNSSNAPRLSTRNVVRLGFAGAAAVCVGLTAGGAWITHSMRQADAELQALQGLNLKLGAAVRSVNDLILTAGSKSAREAYDRNLEALRQQVTGRALAEGELKTGVSAVMSSVEAVGRIAKPSPDNDDALIAYGKLSALTEQAQTTLDRVIDDGITRTERHARMLGGALAAGAVMALLLVTGCAFGVLRRLRSSLGGELEQAQALMQRVGRGDLSPVELPPHVSGASVIGALAQMVEQLRASIGQVQASADRITGASGEIAAGSQDLSQRTELNAGSLQQTASAMEELTANVGQTADSARHAQELAVSASQVAKQGGTVVGEVVETMNAIQASSRRIGDIIGTIDGIAFQTNILALNAAVEAARAGEAGRGFAVVASEVRSLAQRSANAAREIKELINASVESVDGGTRLVSSAGATMQEIVRSVQRVSDVIAEISHATDDQSSGLGQVNQSVTQLDHATQQNTELVEQSAAAARALEQEARSLTAAVAAFRMA